MNKLDKFFTLLFIIALIGFIYYVSEYTTVAKENSIIFNNYCVNIDYDKSNYRLKNYNETFSSIKCGKEIINVNNNIVLNVTNISDEVIFKDEYKKVSEEASLILFFTIISAFSILMYLIVKMGEVI